MAGPAMAPAAPPEFYAYSVEFLPVAAGDTDTQEVTTQAESTFVVDRVSAWVGPALATVTDAPELLVQIKDSGSGAEWFDRPVHFVTLFFRGGARDFLFILPERAKRRLAPNTTTRVTVENLAAADRFARLTFYGWKEYI